MKIQNSSKSKGQLSLEFILVLAIALSFLILWLPAVIATQNGAQSAIGDFYLRKIADDISYTTDSLCILGEGNERIQTVITDAEIWINSSSGPNKTISIISYEKNITLSTKCATNISIRLDKGRTELIFKNENEIISVK